MVLGILCGAVLGSAANARYAGHPRLTWLVENVSETLGKMFLNLLFMLVVPILFSALVMGVCELDFKRLGRLGIKALAYTVVVSTIAVSIGLFLVNVLAPGKGLPDEVRTLAHDLSASKALVPPAEMSIVSLLLSLVPGNPIKAAAEGNMLGFMVFSLLFGAALSMTKTRAAESLKHAIQGLNDVVMTLINGVLWLAPVGVALLLFTTTARLGTSVLRPLAAYVAVVLLGLGLHMFGVYSLSVRFLGGRSPRAFFRDVRLAMVTAFSTSSSSATLPTAIKVAEEELKLPRHVSRFVLTAGSAMNQNGTALFEGVTVLFLAQLYGVEMGLLKQAIVMGICVLGGIGTAGVPASSIPVVAMILGLFGIPPEGLGLILGVDRFLDMCRTTLNVTGDLAAAVYVARGEPDLPAEETAEPLAA
jgi:DAACS family dicarboxylate/amino acid:cation (Na+ or H+) symporter